MELEAGAGIAPKYTPLQAACRIGKTYRHQTFPPALPLRGTRTATPLMRRGSALTKGDGPVDTAGQTARSGRANWNLAMDPARIGCARARCGTLPFLRPHRPTMPAGPPQARRQFRRRLSGRVDAAVA